jgi:hypothetical protein
MNKPAPAPVPALIEQHTVSDKKTKTIPLAGLVTKGMQLRVTSDKDAIARYAEAYTNGEELPPIVVFDDGEALLVADGHHRVAASDKAGKKSIECIIKKGDRRAARLYASRANLQHGVPLTNDDKRNIVRDLLGDAEWFKWSDREIARHTGTSPNFVGKIRKSLPKDQQSTVRKGKDGIERDTKHIGKVQSLPEVSGVAAYLHNSLSADDWKGDEIELTILPPPARGPGFAVILSVCRGKTRWHVGHTIECYAAASKSGANIHPCKSDEFFTTWPKAIRTHLMGAVLGSLEHDKAHRKIRLFIADLAQHLEHLELAWAAGEKKRAAAKSAPQPEPEYPSDEPETLTVDDPSSSAGASADEDLDAKEGAANADDEGYGDRGKETPPIDPTTPAGKRLTFARELLGERLAKEKHQWCGRDQELVSLALVVGVPSNADDEPWSNDLVVRAWRTLTDRVQAEVADRLTRGETTKLPPIELLAKWWGIDHAELVIRADRAVGG